MRKLSILSYIFAGLMLSSCDGYLKEDPRDQLYPEDAYDTPQNVYLNTVASLYNYIGGYSDSQGLQGTYRGVYDLNTFTTDEAMLPTRGGDWYDGGFWQGLFLHKWGTNSAFQFQEVVHAGAVRVFDEQYSSGYRKPTWRFQGNQSPCRYRKRNHEHSVYQQ